MTFYGITSYPSKNFSIPGVAGVLNTFKLIKPQSNSSYSKKANVIANVPNPDPNNISVKQTEGSVDVEEALDSFGGGGKKEVEEKQGLGPINNFEVARLTPEQLSHLKKRKSATAQSQSKPKKRKTLSKKKEKVAHHFNIK